MTVENLWFDL